MSYKTIAVIGEGYYEEKKSKFIAKIIPVASAEEALQIVAETKKKNRDAAHNVFAYRIKEGNTERQSDDGEPSGTSGMPILSVLKGAEIFDVLCIVTRYFGGTLLGTGGLVRAYGSAAADALSNTEIVELVNATYFTAVIDYKFLGIFDEIAPKLGAVISDRDFADKIAITFYIKSENADKFCLEMTDKLNGKIEFSRIKEVLRRI